MEDRVLLAHGSGGKLSQDLVKKYLVTALSNPFLDKMDDSAVLYMEGCLAFTTDSYVVSPIFFPGGDIGKLAVCGTVNDLSMSGAVPQYLSLSLIIEEGLLLSDLETIIKSVKDTVSEAGIKIVTGDTKVVNRGSADKIFINTSGIGKIPPGINISGSHVRPGDKIIVSGTIGDHGIAIVSQREGLKFHVPVPSDCAPLNGLVADMIDVSSGIHALRDPTRGGLGTALNEFAQQSQVYIIIDETSIPVHKAVQSACELLGFDPLYLANEGKLVAAVAPEDADRIVARMRQNKYGENATIIGEVSSRRPGRVVMKTRLGASRIIDTLTGELLPRIC